MSLAPSNSSNDQAFAAIYSHYTPYLTRYLARHNKDLSRDTIEDIVQDVLVGVWIRRSTWHPTSIPAYLTAAVKKRLIDHLRSRKREEPLDLSTHQPAVPSLSGGMHTPVPSDNAHHHSEIEKAVATSISRIPTSIDRAIARHHFYEQLTPGAIVKILTIRNIEVLAKIAKAREHIAVDLYAFGVRAPLQRLNQERVAADMPVLTRSPYEDTIDMVARMRSELERNPRINRIIGTIWGPSSLLGEYTTEEIGVLQELSSDLCKST